MIMTFDNVLLSLESQPGLDGLSRESLTRIAAEIVARWSFAGEKREWRVTEWMQMTAKSPIDAPRIFVVERELGKSGVFESMDRDSAHAVAAVLNDMERQP